MRAEKSAGKSIGTSTKPRKPLRKILPSPLKGTIREADLVAVIDGVHVTPRGKTWEVFRTGDDGVRRRFGSQERALQFARKVGGEKSAKVYLHEPGKKVRILNQTGSIK